MNLADVVAGSGARLYRTAVTGLVEGVAAPSQLQLDVSGFSADSRSAVAGDFFFALSGERVDGHDFVESVLNAGAAGVVVAEKWLEGRRDLAFPANRWVLAAPDPLSALHDLARRWRSKHNVTVIGVTGSVGKTTVKELTAQALSPLGPGAVLKSSGNFNSEVGLPLELLKLDRSHRFAVLEMAMYQRGDIALLAEIAKPTVGIVTNVQANHLERTGSIERTAQAKAELVHALPPSGLAVLNGDDRLVRLMRDGCRPPAVLYGTATGMDFSSSEVESLGRAGFSATVRHGHRTVRVRSSLVGTHNAVNVLPSLAVAHYAGIDLEASVAALSSPLSTGRLRFLEGPAGSTIIDDAYNASAVSVTAALDVLMAEPGRHLALLGDMFELGEEEEREHRIVGRHAAGLDGLILLGPRTRWIAEEARNAGLSSERIVNVETREDAISTAIATLRAGDAMLIKGSRGLRLDEVVHALTEGAQ